jgi:hypothetical protein
MIRPDLRLIPSITIILIYPLHFHLITFVSGSKCMTNLIQKPFVANFKAGAMKKRDNPN